MMFNFFSQKSTASSILEMKSRFMMETFEVRHKFCRSHFDIVFANKLNVLTDDCDFYLFIQTESIMLYKETLLSYDLSNTSVEFVISLYMT